MRIEIDYDFDRGLYKFLIVLPEEEFVPFKEIFGQRTLSGAKEELIDRMLLRVGARPR